MRRFLELAEMESILLVTTDYIIANRKLIIRSDNRIMDYFVKYPDKIPLSWRPDQAEKVRKIVFTADPFYFRGAYCTFFEVPMGYYYNHLLIRHEDSRIIAEKNPWPMSTGFSLCGDYILIKKYLDLDIFEE